MSSTNGTPESSPGPFDLYPEAEAWENGPVPQDYLRALWRGKWFILGVILLLGGGTYLYYQTKPHQYRAETVMMLNKSDRPERMADVLLDQPTNRVKRERYFLEHSQVFARKVAEALTSRADSLSFRDGRILFSPGSASSLAVRIQEATTVYKDSRDVPALRVEVKGTDPEEVALVANTYVDVYREHMRRTKSARMRTTSKFLEEQKRKLEAKLRALEDSIDARLRANGEMGLLSSADSTLGVIGQTNQLAQKVSDLTVQKNRIELDLKMERALLDSARARLRRIRPNLADRAASTTPEQLRQTHQTIADLEAEIRAIRARNDNLSRREQSQVDEMQARVERLRRRANRLAEKYVQQALSTDAINPLEKEGNALSPVVELKRKITQHRVAITRLSAKREAITERLQEYRAALRASPDRTLDRLRRRKNTTQELFMSLTKSLQRVQVSEESVPEQVSVLQPATPPSQPIAPNTWRNVLLALLLGGVGASGLVLFYDRFDDVVEEPDDLGHPADELFGTIPEWESDTDLAVDSKGNVWTGVAAPFSPVAEAYRQVSTNIRLGLPNSVTTLLVTSPGAREGKTTTVANLGVALSETGQDVLLVDADLQGPSLHKMFGAKRTPGLTDRLADLHQGARLLRAPEWSENGQASAPSRNGESLQTHIHEKQQQQMGRLGLLAAGTEVPQPALLLQERNVQPLIDELTKTWDLVLFDTPPALPYDDAVRLAALSDLVLLLASAGSTERSAFRDVRARLDSVSPHDVVPLLNRHRSAFSSYGYGYYSYASTYNGTDEPPVGERLYRSLRRIVKGGG